jgi:AraC-like DNA-binding protein
MLSASDVDCVHRFAAAVQMFAGRAVIARKADLPRLFAAVVQAIPDPLDPAARRIVRDLIVQTVCNLELLLASKRPADDLSRWLLAFWAADSAGQLRALADDYALELNALVELEEPSAGKTGDRRVARALTFIRRNCDRPSLTLADVSDVVRLSKWHLDRLLRRYTARCFKAHLRQARMEHATALLEEGLLTVKEIARRIGYSSVTEFDRQFRLYFHTTPTAWRASHVPGRAASADSRGT